MGIMGWKSSAVVRFDLGPLLEGQTVLLTRLLCPPHWGVDILFFAFPPSGVTLGVQTF